MTMSDAAAEACVAYLLDQLVSDGRDAADAVVIVQRAASKWMDARTCQSGQEITQEG